MEAAAKTKALLFSYLPHCAAAILPRSAPPEGAIPAQRCPAKARTFSSAAPSAQDQDSGAAGRIAAALKVPKGKKMLVGR
ncbi:hypothetical protein ACP70R_023060 [Stipagrostis hirtigluma subsp. patula]